MSVKSLVSFGAMILASTAGVFIWRKRKNQGSDFLQRQILTRESYKEITSTIRLKYSQKYWPQVKKFRIERRTYSPSSQIYHNIVVNFQKIIKKLIDESTAEVLKDFRVSKEIFEESVNFYDEDPELKEYGENLIKAIPEETNKSVLSRALTNEILRYFSNRLKEKNSECIELDDYLLSTSEIEDEIFKRYNVEMEELTFAVEEYKEYLHEIVDDMKRETSTLMVTGDDSF
jgi:hypothetical protein